MSIPYDNYLYHHGIMGMKWGKRNGPPYPLSSGQMSRTERKHAMTKEEAIKSGTADDVLKYKGNLTNQELQTAVTRLNLEKQLKTISESDKKKGYKRTNKVLDAIGSKVLIPMAVGGASLLAKNQIDGFMRGFFGDNYTSAEVQKFLNEVYRELFKGVNVVKK